MIIVVPLMDAVAAGVGAAGSSVLETAGVFIGAVVVVEPGVSGFAAVSVGFIGFTVANGAREASGTVEGEIDGDGLRVGLTMDLSSRTEKFINCKRLAP